MSENKYLAQWRDIRFGYSENSDHADVIVLLFDDIETGREAMRFIKTWQFMTIAFVKKKDNAIDIHLYDDTNPNQYSLIAPEQGVWERDDVGDFIKNRPDTKMTPVMCGAYTGEELNVPAPAEQLTVYVPGYIFTEQKHFRNQKLSDRN